MVWGRIPWRMASSATSKLKLAPPWPMSSNSPRCIASRTAWRSSPAGVRMRFGLPLKQWVSRSPSPAGRRSRRDPAACCPRAPSAAGCHCPAGSAWPRAGLQAALAHHAAAHARLDADDEGGWRRMAAWARAGSMSAGLASSFWRKRPMREMLSRAWTRVLQPAAICWKSSTHVGPGAAGVDDSGDT